MASPADFPWPPPNRTQKLEFTNVTFQGRSFRVFQRPANIRSQAFVIRVGGQLEDNRNMLARFSIGLIAAIPAMLVLSALGGYFLSRRVLEPVDKITAAARSISIGNLSRRLPVPNRAMTAASGGNLQ